MTWVIFSAPDGTPLLVHLEEINHVRPPIPTEQVGDLVGAALFTMGNRLLIHENFDEVIQAMIRSGLKVCWPNGTPVKSI
jgi:hypothetical protein